MYWESLFTTHHSKTKSLRAFANFFPLKEHHSRNYFVGGFIRADTVMILAFGIVSHLGHSGVGSVDKLKLPVQGNI